MDAPTDIEQNSPNEIRRKIAELEQRLAEAKQILSSQVQLQEIEGSTWSSDKGSQVGQRLPIHTKLPAPSTSANHFLFLLSDSALPLGSFAFSSGLESYLAHNRGPASSSPTSFQTFLPLSLSSFASTSLPFVLASHRNPSAVAELDDAFDAAIMCTVGRRASVAQGRALLSIWERSLAASMAPEAAAVLRPFAKLLKSAGASSSAAAAAAEGWDEPPLVSAHLAPLFGAICNLAGLGLAQTAYVFLLSHVKALVSAAVRASMFGPYQAQKVLASPMVQDLINTMVQREWGTEIEDAGQTVPIMDLWIGRHEVLYSRIFNS